jgi:hypothetical protein
MCRFFWRAAVGQAERRERGRGIEPVRPAPGRDIHGGRGRGRGSIEADRADPASERRVSGRVRPGSARRDDPADRRCPGSGRHWRGSVRCSATSRRRDGGGSGPRVPDDVWVTVPRSRNPRAVAGLRLVRSRHLPASAVCRLRGVPLLSPGRTVADLALHLDDHELAAVALSTMQRGLCTYQELVFWQATLAGRAGSGALRRALEQADPAYESILSAEFGELVARGGVPLLPGLKVGAVDLEVDPGRWPTFGARSPGDRCENTPRSLGTDTPRRADPPGARRSWTVITVYFPTAGKRFRRTRGSSKQGAPLD